MIDVRNLTKSFGNLYALRGLNLTVSRGTCLTIFGPNGAGKSTFIRILATLSKPTQGEIRIEGKDIFADAEQYRNRLGVIAHATYLYDELTARENLVFYSKLYGIPDRDATVNRLLDEVGLGKRGNDRVRTFSRGMQQRLSIARAMLHNPDILLLDEPYTGLDQHASEMLTGWIMKLRNDKRTIILITHDLAQGLEVADEVAIFLRGRVAHSAAAGDFSNKEFQQLYFETVAGGRTN
ncbi:MAG TPA: heme ABC exporter ATP-binding protein CcmA [Bacteroidetes bacterium]|nr:heme ABC exporter ATP-binding protein CcmA [Bacteroidota bacterium]